MAEVGTIVGIISLGIQVADGLVKYYTGYNDRESDTAHTVKRLTHLLSVLEILRKHLADRKFQPDEKSLLETIERSVGDCEDLINELQQETDKFTKTPSAGVVAAARVTGRRLAYPFRQSTLQKLDEDIDEICANLTLALQVLQQHDLSSVQDEIQDTKALLELVRASQVSSEIRDLLKAPDASVNYNEACKKKHPGTGLWFIKSPQFNTWLMTPNSFLWLKGFAGCGKSVLSSTIIQHTLRHRRSNPSIGIAFFYFTFSDDSKQDTSAMLRALILQLVAQLNDQQTLPRLHQSYPGGTPPAQALLDCLHQLVAKFDDVYIVLDALDESPRHKHREDVLQALEDMRGWPGPELHLLVTSRDEQDIREYLDPSDDQVVSMKNDLIDADIASFVSGHLKDNRRLRKWGKFHDQIERTLTEGAKGVFRWVECQFTALEACPGSKTRLDALLGSLPRTLDKTYERMLYSIEEESVEDAKRILTLLCTAKRPLRVEELIDGIAVELGDDPKFNEDSRLMNVNDIRHICPGFIEVDLEVTVRIAHYSVQEYLESDRILTSGTARFSVRRAQANTEVASICLAYLLDPGLSEAYLNQVEDFHDKYPLAAYAASNWSEHYHEGSPSDPRLHHLALALFHDDQVALVSWANIYKWGGYKRDGLGDRILSPLYLAARLGLDPVVRVLADETAAARPSKNYFELALIAAATHGHATSVQLLLDHGVAIDYQGFEGTALHTAAQNGHVRVVEILLNHGADIEAQDYRCRSALYKAVSTGQDDIVRLLLDRGADVSPLGTYNTPLECAASNGREAMVGMLLDHGATPNRGRYHLPLSGALDDARVARLLIDRGAVINQGHLTSACFSGSPGVVALLLDRGADVDHAGGLANLLENAVSGENIGVLELLLDRNSDVRRTGVLTDLLEREVGTSKVDIVRVLLDRINNDDGIGSGSGKTTGSGDLAGLLERAAGCAELDVVRLLLDRGADPNKGQNRTPLEVAVSRGSTDVLELLLRKGADVNAGGEMTPLEKAAWERNVDIVRFLLREGADVDLGIRMTPLEAAASGKAEDIMKLLLEKGADANKGVQMTPLETLVDGGVEPFSMVELLVQRGADVNRGLKMNPLQVAKDKGHDLESITVLPDRNNSSEELGEPTIMKGLILEPVGTWGQPLTEKALDMPLLPALASLETSRLVDRTYSVEQQGIPIGVGSPQTKGVGDERHVIELAAS